jgi:hypothetical protein
MSIYFKLPHIQRAKVVGIFLCNTSLRKVILTAERKPIFPPREIYNHLLFSALLHCYQLILQQCHRSVLRRLLSSFDEGTSTSRLISQQAGHSTILKLHTQ